MGKHSPSLRPSTGHYDEMARIFTVLNNPDRRSFPVEPSLRACQFQHLLVYGMTQRVVLRGGQLFTSFLFEAGIRAQDKGSFAEKLARVMLNRDVWPLVERYGVHMPQILSASRRAPQMKRYREGIEDCKHLNEHLGIRLSLAKLGVKPTKSATERIYLSRNPPGKYGVRTIRSKENSIPLALQCVRLLSADLNHLNPLNPTMTGRELEFWYELSQRRAEFADLFAQLIWALRQLGGIRRADLITKWTGLQPAVWRTSPTITEKELGTILGKAETQKILGPLKLRPSPHYQVNWDAD